MTTSQTIRPTQGHFSEERPQWRLFKGRASRGNRAPFHPVRVSTTAQSNEEPLPESHNLSEAVLLEDMAPCAEQAQLTPSGLDKKPPVQSESEADDIPTTPKCYLLAVPPEILDGILKWLAVSDQQSVAWTSKTFFQNYIPILQGSSQEFPPPVEDYLLLQRKPQRKKSEIPCCPPEERPREPHCIDWWRIRHTESCTLKFSNSVRLCPCLVIGPRVFLDFIWKLKRDQTLITFVNHSRVGIKIRNDKTDFQHECTISNIPSMDVSLSMQISTVSDMQLLVFTEYRIHVEDAVASTTMRPLYICPHEQDIVPWLRTYFDCQEKGAFGWQADYELCPWCQIMICRGQGPRDLVIRVRSGLYQEPLAERYYSVSIQEFPVRPFSVSVSHQDQECRVKTTEEQFEIWGGIPLC